jgi:hypothetical protein
MRPITPEFHWHLLYQILYEQEKLMSALTDLQGSVSKLATDVAALVAENNTGASDADLVALKAQIDAIDATLPQAPAAG